MGSQGQPDPLEPGFEPYLTASRTFLCHRKFEHCRKYAARALNFNPKHPGPPQLLAIAGILSVCPSDTRHEPLDCYSILDLPRFTQDPNVIRAQFDLLKDIVNPEKNPYPFAAEACQWVVKAGSVLFDPDLKSQFDRDLKTRQNDAAKDGGSFWTVCPYCYFMFEYESVYKNCVLRCQNVKCRKAFTAVAVAASAVPTPEVVEKGRYRCHGFLPMGPHNAKEGKDNRWKWWAPFVSMGSGASSVDQGTEEARTYEESKTKNADFNDVIDLTEGDEMEEREEIKKRGDVDGDNRGPVVVKRKKVAALGKNKVTGKGIRVKRNPSLQGENAQDGEGLELEIEGNRDGEKSSGRQECHRGHGLEFTAGDDEDIVV